MIISKVGQDSFFFFLLILLLLLLLPTFWLLDCLFVFVLRVSFFLLRLTFWSSNLQWRIRHVTKVKSFERAIKKINIEKSDTYNIGKDTRMDDRSLVSFTFKMYETAYMKISPATTTPPLPTTLPPPGRNVSVAAFY